MLKVFKFLLGLIVTSTFLVAQTPQPVSAIPGPINTVPFYYSYSQGFPVLAPSNISDNGTNLLYKGVPVGAGGMVWPTFHGLAAFNGGTVWVTPTYSNVVSLWTTCTVGYLKFDGTCSTPAGSMTWPATAGIMVYGGSSAYGTSLTAPIGAIVGTTDTQTLTNKTVDGVTVSTMAFVDPTSSIQTQLNGKQATGSYITALTGDATASGPGSAAITVVKLNGVSLAGLATGLMKNTTVTGAPSIAVAGTDYLTPTGSATGLSKASNIAFGVAECDNTTISCPGGVFTALATGGMTWPAAAGIMVYAGSSAYGTSLTAPTGAIVGTTDTQTLTNKTLDGVTSATMAFVDPTSSIQTQLNGKQATIGVLTGTNGGTGVNNASRTMTYAGNVTFTGAFNASFTVPSASTWILPTGGDTLVGLAATQTLTNKTLDGVAPATMAFVDPTSSIQTQLNGKQATGSYVTALTGDVTASGPGSVSSTVTGLNGTNLAGLATGLIKNTTITGVPTIVATPTGTIVGTTDTQTLTNKTLDGVAPATMVFVDPTSSIQTQLNGKQATGSYITSLTGDGTASGPGAASLTITKINGVAFSGLATGLVKNTTTTGAPSIAVAGTDYLLPTGSATALSKASNVAFGVAECDGTTISCTGGVFSTVGSGSMTWPSTAGMAVCTGTPCTAWTTSKNVPTGSIVGTTDTQSLSSKTITSSTLDGSVVGGTTPAAGTFTTLSTSVSGNGPGTDILQNDTGSIPALPTNSAGFAGPASGGTSYLFKLPASVTAAGILHAAATATADGVNESLLSIALVSNSDLVNASVTVNGTVCTLGSSCTVGGGTGNTTSTTLTTNVLSKANGPNSIIDSLATENGTTFTITDTGGFVAPSFNANGTTAGFFAGGFGTTSAAVGQCAAILTAGGVCIQAPTAGTSYLKTIAGTGLTGIPFYTYTAGATNTLVESIIAAPTGTIVGTTDTQTLTNKILDGVSPATMAFVDPTSSIQTQLNGKQPSTTFPSGVLFGSGSTSAPTAATAAQVLTAVQSNTTRTSTSTAGTTSFTTLGLTFPVVPASATQHGRCTVTWQMSSVSQTAQFGIGASAAPTGLWVQSDVWTAAAGTNAIQYTAITTTTTTAISAATTAGVVSTNYKAEFDVAVQNGGSANTITLYGLVSSASATLTIEPGSSCYWLP